MLKSPGFATSSRGNVLFLILIAVALFGLLTAAITKGDRGSTSMDRERGTISASDYMSYAAAMEKTVARLMGDDMSENGLSFENEVWLKNDDSDVETAAMFPNCTTSRCKVFDPAGGGMAAQAFAGSVVEAPVTTDIKPGHAGVFALRVKGIGTDAHDLVLMIAGIDQNTCKQINSQLGITNPNGFPPQDAWGGAILYEGTFTGTNDATDQIGDAATEIEHRPAGCVNRSGAGGKDDNWFYQVLLTR